MDMGATSAWVRAWRRCAAAAVMLLWCVGVAGGDDRWWVLMRDGTEVGSDQIKDWHAVGKEPTVGRQRLFASGNPVRLMRDTEASPVLRGPRVLLRNGDVLPGTVTGFEAGSLVENRVAGLVVNLTEPLRGGDRRDRSVAIRASDVSAVVRVPGPGQPPVGGTVLTLDGRRLTSRLMRWEGEGLRVLTESGMELVGFTEIAEAWLPESEPGEQIAAVLGDGRSPSEESSDLIGRLRTAEGAELTYRHRMLRAEEFKFKDRAEVFHVVQPGWALSPIRVPYGSIAMRSYRDFNEVPLSLLPIRRISQKSYTGYEWGWSRNWNLSGEPLASGWLSADLGLGTHAFNRLAVTLPSGVRAVYGWAGVDRSVSGGGCVVLRLYRDSASGPPVWDSGFLRGTDPPVKYGPLDISPSTTLVLETDFGHVGRPKGADPADIRDRVGWLMPLAVMEPQAMIAQSEDWLARWFPALTAWEIGPGDRARLSLSGVWNSMAGEASAVLSDGGSDWSMSRRVTVNYHNQRLRLAVARASDGYHPEVQTLVDAKAVEGGTIRTRERRPFEPIAASVDLSPWMGRTVELSVRVRPEGRIDKAWAGLIVSRLGLECPIDGPATESGPIKPDIPITARTPTRVTLPERDVTLRPGRMSNRESSDLTLSGVRFVDGYGLPSGSSLSYDLTDFQKRFVAVIGHHWGDAVRYRVLIDDAEAMASPVFAAGDRPVQVVLDIPRGSRKLTLVIEGRGWGAWAEAGFMLK